ncbi:MAG: hypothetical protein WD232_00995 [Acidimicrobiales bacterium]
MESHESSAKATSPDRGDSVNDNTGTGASGPGDPAYDDDSQTGDVGGEAQIDLEDKARRMAQGEPSADPALVAGAEGADQPPEPNPDVVSENPEVQSGG